MRAEGIEGATRFGAVIAIVTASVAIALRDVDAALITVGLLIGLALLRFRRGALGVALLGVLFALTLFFCGLGAVMNFSHRGNFFSDALTSVLAVLALGGIVILVTHRTRMVQIGTGALVVVALIGSFAASRSARSDAKQGDIALVTQHLRFVPKEITVHSGQIAVALSNRDFFWHTFTISKLHVNVNVATRGQSRIEFQAHPGTYEFVCLIHEGTGMKGTLIVR